MVRAASKNYKYVTVITNSMQYDELIHELNKNKGFTTLNFRKRMCEIAFAETGYYDSLIANYFNTITNNYFTEKKIQTHIQPMSFESAYNFASKIFNRLPKLAFLGNLATKLSSSVVDKYLILPIS